MLSLVVLVTNLTITEVARNLEKCNSGVNRQLLHSSPIKPNLVALAKGQKMKGKSLSVFMANRFYNLSKTAYSLSTSCGPLYLQRLKRLPFQGPSILLIEFHYQVKQRSENKDPKLSNHYTHRGESYLEIIYLV